MIQLLKGATMKRLASAVFGLLLVLVTAGLAESHGIRSLPLSYSSSATIGIGISPDGTLHVHTASAGTVTPDGFADDLVVENSTDSGITLLAPDLSSTSLYFGSPTDALGALLDWNHNNDLMRLETHNAGASLAFASDVSVEAIRIDSNQNVGIGTTVPDELVHLSGGVDGRFTALLIENSQAAAASSENETAEILFGFGGNNLVARISADKRNDYTSASEEDSRLSFWVDADGVLTQSLHVMPDGLMLAHTTSRIRFNGANGGGNQSIQYADTGGSLRHAFLFPGSDIVAVVNRAVDGVVEIRANDSTVGGGVNGEVRVAVFSDTELDLLTGQIQFPATQAASSGANTLDDYEEGTFTPTAIFAAGSGTITYTTQLGRYTKIGDIVFFSIDLETLDIVSRTGDMTIGGLPFTSTTVPGGAVRVGFAGGLTITAGMSVTGNVNASSTIIAVRLWDAIAGTTALQDTEWTDDGRVLLAGWYHV